MAGGIGNKQILWVIRIIYLVFVAWSIYAFVNAFVVTQVDISDAETHMLFNRLRYVPNGISEMRGDRVYPGIINNEIIQGDDISSETLLSRLQLDEDLHVARFSIRNSDTDKTYTGYIHSEQYDRWQVPALFIWNGGKAFQSQYPYPESRQVIINGDPGVTENVIIKNE